MKPCQIAICAQATPSGGTVTQVLFPWMVRLWRTGSRLSAFSMHIYRSDCDAMKACHLHAACDMPHRCRIFSTPCRNDM